MAFWNKREESLTDGQVGSVSGIPAVQGQPAVGAASGSQSVPRQGGVDGVVSESAPGSAECEPDVSERYGKIRSALGPGTVIQGKLSFDTTVRIDGKLSGEIFSSKTLVVGEQGTVDAQVEVANLVVMGSVRGTIRATQGIELLPGASLDATITTPSLSIAEGACFNGECRMSSSKKGVSVLADTDKRQPEQSPKESR